MNYIQEAEKRLRHYRDLENSIEQMNRDIARIVSRSSPSELNALAMDVTGIRSSKVDEAYNVLFELQTLRDSINSTTEEIADIKDILKEISREKDCHLYGKVLYLWYVKRAEKDDIAREIGYTARHVYRIKDEAIRKFAVRILGIKALDAI
jgi:DNA polymerase/3'-5' exonuclease PolX